MISFGRSSLTCYLISFGRSVVQPSILFVRTPFRSSFSLVLSCVRLFVRLFAHTSSWFLSFHLFRVRMSSKGASRSRFWQTGATASGRNASSCECIVLRCCLYCQALPCRYCAMSCNAMPCRCSVLVVYTGIGCCCSVTWCACGGLLPGIAFAMQQRQCHAVFLVQVLVVRCCSCCWRGVC